MTMWTRTGVVLVLLAAMWLSTGVEGQQQNVTFTRPAGAGGLAQPRDSRAAIVDFDSDGNEDVSLVGSVAGLPRLQLMRSNGDGTFANVTASWSGLPSDAGASQNSATWGDFDNDGHDDLFIAVYRASPLLNEGRFYRNLIGQGSQGFALVQSINVAHTGAFPAGVPNSAAWADFDLDGDLDIYLNRYLGPGMLLQNNPGQSPRFTNVAACAGINQGLPAGRGVGWSDVDLDGDSDLFVVNDQNAQYPLRIDQFYVNLAKEGVSACGGGVPKFQSDTSSGLHTGVIASTDLAFGDYDADGDDDVYFGLGFFQLNLLYRNERSRGFLSFVETAASAGVQQPADGGPAEWGDLDNDGDLDLLASDYSNQPAVLYRNNQVGSGSAVFTDITAAAGYTGGDHQSGVHFFDANRDGNLDVVAPFNGTNGDNRLYLNQLGPTNYLRLRLSGVQSNRSGIGARISILANGRWQHRQVQQAGDGAGGQAGRTVHFGLGPSLQVTRTIVRWPSGIVQIIDGIAARQDLTIVEAATDTDQDFVLDGQDNCADAANADQSDRDGDGIGDACDASPDGVIPAGAMCDWRAATNLPWTSRLTMTAAIGGKIYAGQGHGAGYGKLAWFDPANPANGWTEIPVPSSRIALARASAEVNGTIYYFGGEIIGGNGAVSQADAFDTVTGRWKSVASLPTPRESSTAVAVNGKIYVMGGYPDHPGLGKVDNDAYDPATNTWQSRAPLPRRRTAHSAAAVGGKIYVFGGNSDATVTTVWDVVDVYDPATNTWETLTTPSPRKRRNGGITVIRDRIYLVGGDFYNANTGTYSFYREVDVFDPVTRQWSAGPMLPAASARDQVGAASDGVNLYLIGGEVNGTIVNKVDVVTICDLLVQDSDDDTINDDVDNCKLIPNTGQQNQDNDAFGDACDDDIDGDGYPNAADFCPLVPSYGNLDSDGDHIGDPCDTNNSDGPLGDGDGDSVANNVDNCPTVTNSNQRNNDGDGFGDACDLDIDDLNANASRHRLHVRWSRLPDYATGIRIDLSRLPPAPGACPEDGYQLVETHFLPESGGLSSSDRAGGKFDLTELGCYRITVRAFHEGEAGQASSIVIKAATWQPSRPSYQVLLAHGFLSGSTTWEELGNTLLDRGWLFGGRIFHPSGSPTLTCFDRDGDSKTNATARLLGCGTDDIDPDPDDHELLELADFFTIDFSSSVAATSSVINGVTRDGVRQQGLEAKNALAAIRGTQYSPRDIAVIGHSLGGLALRSGLTEPQLNSLMPHVARLITYGTPHLGVDPLDSESALDLTQGPAPHPLLEPVWLGGFVFESVVHWLATFAQSTAAYRDTRIECGNGARKLPDFLSNLGLPTQVDRFVSIGGSLGLLGNTLTSSLKDCDIGDWDILVPTFSANMKNVPHHGLDDSRFRSLLRKQIHLGQPEDVGALMCALDDSCLVVTVHSPVDVALIAPDGSRLSKDRFEIPGGSFESFDDAPGHETATLLVPFAGAQTYRLQVVPKPDAAPNATYSIEVTTGGVTTVVVDNAPIGSNPVEIPVTTNAHPVARAGNDQTLEAVASNGANVTLSAESSYDPDGPNPSFTWTGPFGTLTGRDISATVGLGTHTITLTATDEGGATSTDDVIVRIVDSTAPTLTVPTPITVEATGPTGAVVTFTASATDLVDGLLAPHCAPASGSQFAIGVTNVRCDAIDHTGNSASQLFAITVRDSTSPVITSLSPSPSLLWPPNGNLVAIALSLVVDDAATPAPECAVSNVTSNEPASAGTDWTYQGLSLKLKAKRQGGGSGRTYTITVGCRDNSGNASSATTTVIVPHDQRK
jgi:N-acetylneuraminic acid mutarotase